MVFLSETFFQLTVLHKYKSLPWEFDGWLQTYVCGKKTFESGD